MRKNKKNIAVDVIIVSAAIFIFLLIGSLKGGFFVPVDNWIYAWNTTISKPMIPVVMMLISDIMSPGGAIFLGLVALVALLGMKRNRQATMLVLAMVACYLATEIIKSLIQRPRPEIRLAYSVGFSFPSAHAAMATVYFGMLIFLFKDDFKNKVAKNVFIALCAFIALIVSYTRIYLGAHWLSDVLAGLALGILIITTMILVMKPIKAKTFPDRHNHKL